MAATDIGRTNLAGEPTTAEKLRGLPWSIASNSANTIFVQYTFFGSVFVLFLDALALAKGQIGFLLSLLPFAGVISIFAARWVHQYGYKRTYIVFWTARTIIAAGLLLTPWVVSTFGPQVTLIFLAAIVGVFAVVRAIGMTAALPWIQQYVPDAVRGKYTATNNVFTSVVGFLAIMVGGFVLNRVVGLTGFMLLIGIGVVAGFVCAGLAFSIPGGAPNPSRKDAVPERKMGTVLKDQRFVRYMLGVGVLTLATVPLSSFVPLFMQEQVGLVRGNVVLLQIGTLSGSILFSYAWGWAADRYGSKPVMLWGLILRASLPLMWLSIPRFSVWSLYAALGIALLQGAADIGWGIGSARMLYAGLVPSDKRSDYLALYNAWTGVVGGASQLMGGWLLALFAGLSGQILFFQIDQYLPLFLIGIVLPLISLLVLNAVRADELVSISEFTGIFFRGNPFLAMTSMVRFHLSRSEQDTLLMTERLSMAKSPLAVDELLEALHDPRFNVRFEAIVSIARMPVEPRLLEALMGILHGSELALSVVAAWALGRLGHESAYPSLVEGLSSEYRSIQAHSARALGALGRSDVVPLLIERLEQETDKGLQMAFASALGNLGAINSTDELLALLGQMENQGARLELALSLARIVGDERHFVQLVRTVRADAGTAFAQELTSLKRRLAHNRTGSVLLNRCIDTFARGDLIEGQKELHQVIEAFSFDNFSPWQRIVLDECSARIGHNPTDHLDYAILAINILHAVTV